jgi:ABC-type sugar transport system substrate-binding protein
VDCIYATSGGNRGIEKAIKVAGLEGRTFIICHDLYPEVVEMLHSGIVMATIGQDLERQGYLAFKHMVDYLFFGIEPPSKKIYMNIDIRIKENAPAL